ncbi:cellulose synthase/poly-beta-1,6-N-acetylglucosamine synthase-like glycosyltransferase [Thioclava sp. ES.031]|nr:cellulose synthase/poly-beta-1,6-N-acetylglucosamine synthase-like glycosyltransferase [Thioclava sp. ES.031]
MGGARRQLLEIPAGIAEPAEHAHRAPAANSPGAVTRPKPDRPARAPLGQILLDRGATDPGDLLKALALRHREDVRLGDILLANGWVREADLMAALAEQWHASVVDLQACPPDPRLIDAVGAELCLRHAMVPWRRVGGVTLIATARPEDFEALRDALPARHAPYRLVLAPERCIHESLLARRQTALIRRAEIKVDPAESCRNYNEQRASRIAAIFIAVVGLGLWFAPSLLIGVLFAWVMLTLLGSIALKLAAFASEITVRRRPAPDPCARGAAKGQLPIISMMVPLFRETDIAARLVERLGKLRYPRELLDVILVVEQTDAMTLAALSGADLPRWMRVVTVPDGPIKTKPRALNYALNFCRGSVIGIWDAEDAPEPDQLQIAAQRFLEAPPETACLQGILDYYNPRTNWLARCFTVEYATWFRMFLPGLARLGFVVPLGGTTLFFRRDALEKLGGWDAHNVTEDADLGVRLARHGYRTELIPAATYEEANCRALPWVKQRSRWLKGYAMTWAVHMRDPVQLWRDLGTKRFIGVQILILGSLSQYVLAPVLWSFWFALFGLWHPIASALPDPVFTLVMSTFILSEMIAVTTSAWACRSAEHRHLIKWVPTLHFYYPLGALAGWKALYELVARPFYWDKTSHGIFDANGATAPDSAQHGLLDEIAAAQAKADPEPQRLAHAPLIG